MSKAKKKKDDDGAPQGMSLDAVAEGVFGLALNGDALFTSVCYHHLRKVAQQLAEIRHMPKREAMHKLTTDMGFCDETAGRIFLGLHPHHGAEALH